MSKSVLWMLAAIVMWCVSCKKDKDLIARANKHMLLVLDAAHGGTDTGSRRVDNSILEKDLVLEVCRKMAKIAPEYNIEVLLTRTEDKNMGSDERKNIADGVNADAFISVHINRSNTAVPRPYEVFVVPGGARETESRALARVILSRMKKAGKDTLVTDRNVLALTGSRHPAFALECGDIAVPGDVVTMQQENELCRHLLSSVVEWGNSR